MTAVAVVGGLSVDHLVVRGLGARFDCLGGPALFGALGARLITDTSVRVLCQLPRADTRFYTLFTQLGVDTSGSEPASDIPRLWILNADPYRRIVRVEQPAVSEIADDITQTSHHPDPPYLSGPLPADLDGLLASAPPRTVSAGNALVGVDPSQQHLAAMGMDYLDAFTDLGVLLPSRVQLTMLDPDPRRAARIIAQRLNVPVIARLDHEGCYVATGSGCWLISDSEVKVVETTGAGDASAAAAVAAMAAGADPVEAALMGTSVARIALAGWGAEALEAADPISTPLDGVTSIKETTR